MKPHALCTAEDTLSHAALGLRLGMDIVQISAIEESIESFGDRFVDRLFTPAEAAYAREAPGLTAQRLAARFAAKEAAIKAFGLSETGINYRDIEVCRAHDGSCSLALHRHIAAHALANRHAPAALSLSHDGDYAAAVVAAVSQAPLAQLAQEQP